MNEETRTLSVSIEGVFQMDELKLRWTKAVDDVYMKNVEDVEFVSPEVVGVAPGHINIEVSGDVEAMKFETKWFLDDEFDNVQVTIAPTEEEIEEMKQEVEEWIDGLEGSEIDPEDHKVEGEI